MAKTASKVQTGDVVNIVADADYNVGDPINFGSRIGIASTDVGDKIYLDNIGEILATTTTTSNQVIGYAVTEKAGATAGTVNVKLGD